MAGPELSGTWEAEREALRTSSTDWVLAEALAALKEVRDSPPEEVHAWFFCVVLSVAHVVPKPLQSPSFSSQCQGPYWCSFCGTISSVCSTKAWV